MQNLNSQLYSSESLSSVFKILAAMQVHILTKSFRILSTSLSTV